MAMFAFWPFIWAAAHLPISSPALKLSVAKVMSTTSGRVRRGVKRDHVQAGVARRLDGRVHTVSCRRDQNPGVAASDSCLDRLNLGGLVAILFARGSRDA